MSCWKRKKATNERTKFIHKRKYLPWITRIHRKVGLFKSPMHTAKLSILATRCRYIRLFSCFFPVYIGIFFSFSPFIWLFFSFIPFHIFYSMSCSCSATIFYVLIKFWRFKGGVIMKLTQHIFYASKINAEIAKRTIAFFKFSHFASFSFISSRTFEDISVRRYRILHNWTKFLSVFLALVWKCPFCVHINWTPLNWTKLIN